MGWLDNVVAVFAPQIAARRAAWRSAYDEIRNYDAGAGSRMNANWRVVNDSAEMTDRAYRDHVRARARDLERNSDVMNSILGAYARNVIGSGFRLQAKTSDADLNEKLERLWERWCKARNCDVTGTQSLNDILRMAVVRKKIDGGILFVKKYTQDGMLPFSLQMIEVDELDTTQIKTHAKGNRVIGGIEYNRYNRPQGYWVRQYDIDGYTITDPVYIKADDVMFYFDKHRPSQIREMSDMAPTVTRIRDTNEFIAAVSVKQRVMACLSVFIKKQLPPTGLGRTGHEVIDGKYSYNGKTLTPGMIRELNAGDDVEVVNPTGQSADATSFTKLQLRLAGAGQGLSYEATSRDMSETNYSSARQGMIEDEMTYQAEKEKILDILNEIYETFVISCWLTGLIEAKDFWENKAEYFAHDWAQAPKKWIDPLKEANAMRIALNYGLKSFKQVCAENGVDWRTQMDDIAEIEEYAGEKGIENFDEIIFGKSLQKGGEGDEAKNAEA